MKKAAAFAIPLILAACGRSDNTAPGAPSQDEKRALDDAAEMIPADTVSPAATASEAGQ